MKIAVSDTTQPLNKFKTLNKPFKIVHHGLTLLEVNELKDFVYFKRNFCTMYKGEIKKDYSIYIIQYKNKCVIFDETWRFVECRSS